MINKIKLFLFVGLLFSVACQSKPSDKTPSTQQVSTTPAPTTGDPYLVAPKQMGFAKIGMTKAELLKFYANMKADTLRMEMELPCWNIYDTDGKILFQAACEDGKDSVTFLFSTHPKMRTAQGIKIGSHYQELKAAFPDIEIDMAEGLRAFSPSTKMSFGVIGEVDFDEDKDGIMRAKKVKDVVVETIEIY